MKPALKIGLVAAGYVAAFLIASAAVAVRVANTSGPDALASSGMYAFGDSYLFFVVLGLAALVPTGAALYFLRPFRRLWVVLSTLSLGMALTGAAAALLYAMGRGAVAPSPLASLAGFSVLRILLAPILVPVFLIFALFSPHRSPRFALIAATVLEVGVCLYAGCVWFFPMLAQRS